MGVALLLKDIHQFQPYRFDVKHSAALQYLSSGQDKYGRLSSAYDVQTHTNLVSFLGLTDSLPYRNLKASCIMTYSLHFGTAMS